MDAISLDLRLRVLRDCERDERRREATAETFGVSRSFVQKLLRRSGWGDPIAPRPHAGGPAAALDGAALDELRALVKGRPDATLAELSAALRAGGGPAVSVATVCRALQALDLPVKKSRCTRASGTRRGCGRCGAGGGGGQGRRTRRGSCSSTRAGLTRP